APTPRTLRVRAWTDLFDDRDRAQLEEVLPRFLVAARWFGGKARRIKTVEVVEAVPIGDIRRPAAVVAFLNVEYTEGHAETYVLPLTTASGDRARELEEHFPHSVVARVETAEEPC